MAEWWLFEEGGYICSKCGCYYDDYYIGLTPTKCSKCNSEMIVNSDMEVDRNYRLTKGINFVDESKYPEWLLKLRGDDNG